MTDQRIKNSFYLPRFIRITKYNSDADGDLVLEFEIDSATPRELKDGIFRRPPCRGFKHELRIINGKMLELSSVKQ